MKKICPNCFRKIGNFEICPHCGYCVTSDKRELYHLSVGTILEDRYIIGRLLGFGGFGITYKAYDTKLSIPVAIKEFYPSGLVTRSPGRCDIIVFSGNEEKEHAFRANYNRFMEEARTMAKFREHPYIVDVFSYFPANNTAYIVMEFLDGINLKHYLAANDGKMTYEDAISVLTPIMDALEALHKEKIIHRDISPDNIFITFDNKIKLMDLGAARLSSGEQETTLTIVLKPGYAPPEQYQSKSKQGPWTDVYALGATIYRALTGEVPEESIDREVEDELKKPSKLGIKLPLNAEKSIMKAMALKPGLRFQKISEMRMAFADKKNIDFPEVEYKKRRKRRIVSAIAVFALLITTVLGSIAYTRNNTISPQYIAKDTITVWATTQQTAMDNINAGFEGIKENSNYDVEMIYIDENEYAKRLSETVGTDEFPDVFRGDLVDDSFRAENAANVGMFYRYFDMGEYYTLRENQQWLKSKKMIPVSIDIPVVYVNQALLAQLGEKPPESIVNVEQLLQYDISLLPSGNSIYKQYSCTEINRNIIELSIDTEDKFLQNAASIDAFLKLESLCHLGMYSDMRTIQGTDALRGQYVIIPIQSDEVYASYGEMYCISNATTSNRQKLAMYYLSYIASINSGNTLPLHIESLTDYVGATSLSFMVGKNSNQSDYAKKIKIVKN